ncbi:hypothetical protein [Puerhibacterium puerhi]|uniref:hypothetical protein n=1 Tax=Puerhibacterium puerhi TaxID=2692623 RepID=UPI00135BEF1A|nr:hypothetical protein [Puerhibacterium puerhi]
MTRLREYAPTFAGAAAAAAGGIVALAAVFAVGRTLAPWATLGIVVAGAVGAGLVVGLGLRRRLRRR